MSDIAIKVEGLGKQFRLGASQERYRTFRDTVADALLAPVRAFRSLSDGNGQADPRRETLWALRDLSFEVQAGDVVGVVGRNGAGKSTLLKILSRITGPTTGWAEIRGRVGSLLEVGTGFHPELSGRENIFLNGAILGMRKTDIERKFDEIVAFAEVERFIDTAVKHYSTGMYLRLAFAVAAHLEMDILLVDEVLAVGDAAFQKKCLGKMQEATSQGRTVLFVSHNMAAVRSLCRKGIVLKQGQLYFAGAVEEAIHHYNQSLTEQVVEQRGGDVAFTDIFVGNGRTGSIDAGEAFEARCRLRLRQGLPGFRLFCVVQDGDGQLMVHSITDHSEMRQLSEPGEYELRVEFPPLWLKPGVYGVHFKLLINTLSAGKARHVSDNAMLDVSSDATGETLLGCLTPAVRWNVETAPAPRFAGSQALD